MRIASMAVLVALSPLLVAASPQRVLFSVTEQTDGVVTASPSFLAEVGQTATVKLADGMAVEGTTNAPEADGRSWTKVRITFLETADAKMVQELTMRHRVGEGSFEFTEPGNHRHFVVVVKPVK